MRDDSRPPPTHPPPPAPKVKPLLVERPFDPFVPAMADAFERLRVAPTSAHARDALRSLRHFIETADLSMDEAGD